MDFFTVTTQMDKKGILQIYPKFRVTSKSADLMVRGGDFYAIWDEEKGLWSTDEDDVIRQVDRDVQAVVDKTDCSYNASYMWDGDSGVVDKWHKYCQKQCRDNYQMLDEKLIFSNDPANKLDYASKRLNYPLEPGECPAWNKLIGTLYSPEERHKLEWAIGSIVTGDSKDLQKFLVLYGAAGTGKSTILNVVQQLFEGYYTVFDAKALGSNNNAFALEAFKTNPLVAIQHDGDLSRIEDNTRLNSLVSHELMTVNEKFKSTYANRFKCFLFMGTNQPVRITDGKSGLLRRLIDVHPSGKKLKSNEYRQCVKQVSFELGAIACHCRDVYLDDPDFYQDYVPVSMMGASNDFYNFVIDSYHIFKKEDGTTLKSAWEMYKVYCDEAQVPFKLSRMKFKEELKNYFWHFKDRIISEEGSRISSYYSGFRTDIFESPNEKPKNSQGENSWICLKEGIESEFDKDCSKWLAQYASSKETPQRKWSDVTTTLGDIDTSKTHYTKPLGDSHIVIDFDRKDENGNKSLDLNLEAALSWPPTYAEISKGGNGLHLHYIYDGDASKLARLYDKDIEIKVFTGNSSLRRRLSKCNDIPIAHINTGLPLREDKKVISTDVVTTEKGIRTTLRKCINKEVHPNTRPNIDFIKDILDKAYASGVTYDVSDMKNSVYAFAIQSTNQADYCLKTVSKMKWKSEDERDNTESDEAPIAFYDVEVFPNLFLVNWKYQGEGMPIVRMINPKPSDIEELVKLRLVGFNCRRYDNHILYGRLIGYTNAQLYDLSTQIINGGKGNNRAFFREAYNLSYTDVYDFSSKKQSLKKFEIDLGIHHQELGLPWDQPVPEELWDKVAEYCDNDVIATEAVFDSRKADFTARSILADVAGMTVNDTTNMLTTRIIFGGNKKPQNQFNYRNMGDESQICPFLYPEFDDYTVFDAYNRPIFPGYKYEFGKSTYREEEVGEGGYVYAEPGMYGNVALLDIASMHPSSIVAEELFGTEYTARFNDILQARIAIKHKDFDKAKTMLNGSLAKYLHDESAAADLAQALKIAINSVYGLTSASFEHPFHDPRNIDNIVAKRGALFMINLKHEVQKRGFTVAHIKTDSIKIPDATPDIIKFVMDYGKMYGYNFEHEATYERMCLVNNAVYIAKYKDGKHAGEWTATGTQFQIPYVFKRLFSGEPIEFNDLCETKSVSSALYLDMNETLPDMSDLQAEYDKLCKLIAKNNPNDTSEESTQKRLEELRTILDANHDYQFIGRVGLFCPIKPGCGGGELLREGKDKDGRVKYSSATGASGYRWLEAETVSKKLGKTFKVVDNDTGVARDVVKREIADGNYGIIDTSYHEKLCNDAIETINKYGDFEWFVSDDPYVSPYNCAEPPWDDDFCNQFAVR